MGAKFLLYAQKWTLNRIFGVISGVFSLNQWLQKGMFLKFTDAMAPMAPELLNYAPEMKPMKPKPTEPKLLLFYVV